MADSDLNQDQAPKPEPLVPELEPRLHHKTKREPIFNQTPWGVAVLIGVILLTHAALQLAGPSATDVIQSQFGVASTHLYRDIEQGHFGSAIAALIGHQFMHGGTLHLVMNLAMLLQAGPIAEVGLDPSRKGAVRFIVYFLACGICGALLYCGLNPTSEVTAIGASGAISGVFAGFLWAAIGLAKPGQAMLRPVVTSAIIFLLINVGLAWVGRALNVLPIAWESHLGGFLSGVLLYPIFVRFGRPR